MWQSFSRLCPGSDWVNQLSYADCVIALFTAYALMVLDPERDMMRFRPGLTGMLLLALLATLTIPTPYVLLSPGPVYNTIGMVKGVDLLTISGTETYPVSGALDMLTVSEYGGPSQGIGLDQAIVGWFNKDQRVVPREMFYDETESAAENRAQTAADFSASQSYAIGAALHYLNRPVDESVIVSSVVTGSPSDTKLKPQDTITAVDGVPVTSTKQVVTAVRSKPVGAATTFTLVRAGSPLEVSVNSAARRDDPTTKENEEGIPYVGVGVDTLYVAPFAIKFSLRDVGGPSAGMMFSLAIIDRLTPGELTAGKTIAGTGTVDPDGNVGPIGGIQQKIIGAKKGGAELFLAPVDNCDEVIGHVPSGMTVAQVATVSDAVKAIETYTAGGTVKGCEAK